MATAMSSASAAFQSNKAEDEHSLKPSRAAPPVPSVPYSSTQAARVPDQIERPYQANSAQHRQQHLPSQGAPQSQQYSAQPIPSQYQQPQQPQHFSRPSTQQTTYSHPQAPPTRGRQEPVPQVVSPKKRSNSFSFLRRSSSNQPTSRIAQAQQQAALASPPRQPGIVGHQPQPSDGSVTSGSTGIFRARSKDGRGDRNMLRKQSKLKQQQLAELERQQRAQEAATRQPPRLPSHNPLPNIDTFGGEAHSHHAYTDSQAPPALPGNAANFSRPGMASPNSPPNQSRISNPPTTNGDYYEPSGERSASMTNRGRYSYASSTAQTGNINSPRRVRRRKDPIAFNVLVIGTKNSGKTSFISFLRNSLALRADRQEAAAIQQPSKAAFTSQYLETEIDSERVGVTLWDSAGFEKNVVDLQLREMTAFIESKFEDTFSEEQKVVRSPGFRDTHIHCVFLVLDPVRLDSNVLAAAASGHHAGCLNEDLDLQVLKALWGKTTVIPVISKADTLTVNHMMFLKRAVWQSVKNAKLNPLDALELDDDDDEEDDEDDDESDGEVRPKRPNHARQSSLTSSISDEDPYIPMSILSPDPYSMPPYTKYAPKSQSEIGRRYAWGFASPFDPAHCDFIRLRDTIFSEWRADLRELSRVKWYEQWRTSRLRHAPPKSRTNGQGSSQTMPIRDTADRHDARNFSSGARSAPRNAPIDTQQASGAPAPVGMAITTPGGMEPPRY